MLWVALLLDDVDGHLGGSTCEVIRTLLCERLLPVRDAVLLWTRDLEMCVKPFQAHSWISPLTSELALKRTLMPLDVTVLDLLHTRPYAQEVLGVGGAFGLLGVTTPASAGWFQKDVIELEQLPKRTLIGKTQSISWKEAAPVIAAMRNDVREHFAKTGVKGGRELSLFINATGEGGDVVVGIEVENAKGSAAISDGFVASTVAPPGEYLRDDHNGNAGVAPWLLFISNLAKDGYSLKQPLSLFEVYSGQGGRDETVAMYAAVVKST